MEDNRMNAYPFLKEVSCKCDYEIASDEISSYLGYAEHTCKHIKELPALVELCYHLNGSIRGKCGVREEDLQWLLDLHDFYVKEVGVLAQFVLPCGCIGGSTLHIIRSKIKGVLRIVYRIDAEEQPVNPLVIKLWNLLSNTVFLMVLYENKREGYTERVFHSKSYRGD